MRDRIEQGFAAWGHLTYRHAWVVIGAVLLITACLSTQLPKITIDTSTESFLHENDPTRVTYEAFRRQFGRDELILLAIEPPEIFDFTFLERLRRLHEDIENNVPKLEEVTSLVNARETRGEGDELIVGDLLEDWPETPEDLEQLKRRVLANPLYLDTLISHDGRMTTITIETEAYSSIGFGGNELAGFEDSGADNLGEVDDRRFITGPENHEIVMAVKQLVDRYQAPDFKIYLTGSPTMTDHLTSAMQTDTVRFTALAFAAIAIFLTLLFRRLAGVVLPLVVVGLSLLCTLAIMAMSGTPLTLPTEILPSFLLAVGVANSVHILVIFFQHRRLGKSKEASIAFAFSHSALAIVMTSLTTAGALASFAAAEMAPVADLGVFGPLGVVMALVFTIVLLPPLTAVFPMPADTGMQQSGHSSTQRLLIGVGAFSTRHAGAVLGVTAGIVAVALVGAFQIRFSHDPLRWFPEDDYFRVSADVFNERFGGAMSLELLVDTGEENGLHNPEVLGRMQEVARYASTLNVNGVYVGKTVSLVDILKEIHQALNENQPAFYTIPEDRVLVAQELLLFENSGTDDLEDVVDTRFSTGRITMRVPWTDAVHHLPFVKRLDEGLQRIFDDQTEYTLTGLKAVISRTIAALIHSMAMSYVIAFLVITPLMILLIGEVFLGLVSMVPGVVPIIITLGLMGWADIPLDAFTLLVGSIAIGLAVDYTIHFMHNFRRYFGQSGDIAQAVSATLSSTGQAMLYTTLVLATGFFIYLFSTMDNLFYFGLLTGFTISVAFVACVVMAPALMVLFVRAQRFVVTATQPKEVFQ